MLIDVRRATAADLPDAARTLALAFAEYPWTRWSVPAENHEARLEELQMLYLGHALEHGIVLVDGAGEGAAALLPPTAPAPAPALQSRVAELHGDRLNALAAAALPEPPSGAWQLATLGVRPSGRGTGRGSALIGAALAEIDTVAPGSAVSLETSDERNVRLYERHGFAATARTNIPDGPVVISMVRD